MAELSAGAARQQWRRDRSPSNKNGSGLARLKSNCSSSSYLCEDSQRRQRGAQVVVTLQCHHDDAAKHLQERRCWSEHGATRHGRCLNQTCFKTRAQFCLLALRAAVCQEVSANAKIRENCFKQPDQKILKRSKRSLNLIHKHFLKRSALLNLI